jgi:hypothetical protein
VALIETTEALSGSRVQGALLPSTAVTKPGNEARREMQQRGNRGPDKASAALGVAAG